MFPPFEDLNNGCASISRKPLDFTRPVQTRDGRAVRILCTDASTSLTGSGTPQPVVGIIDGYSSPQMWCLDGRYWPHVRMHDSDLIQASEIRTRWVNVYPAGTNEDYLHTNEEKANLAASPSRIACVKVTYQV